MPKRKTKGKGKGPAKPKVARPPTSNVLRLPIMVQLPQTDANGNLKYKLDITNRLGGTTTSGALYKRNSIFQQVRLHSVELTYLSSLSVTAKGVAAIGIQRDGVAAGDYVDPYDDTIDDVINLMGAKAFPVALLANGAASASVHYKPGPASRMPVSLDLDGGAARSFRQDGELETIIFQILGTDTSSAAGYLAGYMTVEFLQPMLA